MESMGEYCSNTPCKWLLDLGKGGAHDTYAHNLFDGMPSQLDIQKIERTSTKLPTFVTMDLPKATPTNSSTICSSYDAKSDHTLAIVVTCVTSTVSSMELLSTDGTTGGTIINIPDSTKAILTNCLTGGADHARVTCQTMMGVPKGVLVPDASSEVSSLWLIAEMDLIKLMPSECLMKCLKGNNKLLVGHPKRNPWPPPWFDVTMATTDST
uniref:Uncharacterized protein n=1 Tax=Oryza barthii TaxID=65489 RepID=A0A0D3GGD9_9ORYZ